MKYLLIACFFLCVAMSTSSLTQAANPFLSKPQTNDREQNPDEAIKPAQTPVTLIPEFLVPILQITNTWQKEMKRQLTHFGREIKSTPFGYSFFLFLMFSFAYGVVHAIGPGHGKSVVMSYFLNRPGKLLHGVIMSNLIAAMHISAGVAVVLVLVLVLDTTSISDFDIASSKLEVISYVLVILIGIYLTIHTIIDLRKHIWLEETQKPVTTSTRSMIFTALATGLVPCPGAAFILLFAVIMGIMLQGLIAMLFIALGMGLTTTAFALLAIGTRRSILLLAKQNKKTFIVVYSVLSFAGAFVVIIIGSLMLANVV